MNLSLPLFDEPPSPRPGLPAPVQRLLAGASRRGGDAPGAGTASDAVPDPARRAGQGLPPPAAAPVAQAGVARAAAPIRPAGVVDGGPRGPGPGDDSPLADRLADMPAAVQQALWQADRMGGGRQRCTPSGFATLDAELPGGGWPHGVLTELLLPRAGIGELRLLGTALTHGLAAASGVMLFDPPAKLSAWALQQQGIRSGAWLVVQGGQVARPPGAASAGSSAAPPRRAQRVPRGAQGLAPLLPGADVLWALEQSLRSGHVGVVLAWLPLALPADALRRLQLAAQGHDAPVFIFREWVACSRPSPAPLRLLLQPAGVDGLSVRVIKRRGPPRDQPLRLQLPPVLTPRQQAQAEAQQVLSQAGRRPTPEPPTGPSAGRSTTPASPGPAPVIASALAAGGMGAAALVEAVPAATGQAAPAGLRAGLLQAGVRGPADARPQDDTVPRPGCIRPLPNQGNGRPRGGP